MARQLRLQYEGALWHITNRGNEGKNIFRDDHDRRVFLELLAKAILRYNWVLHSFCLMNNHFHLVLETPELTLSSGMQWLQSCYVQRFNRRHNRIGHLVESESYLLTLVRYVELNPVRKNYVKRPEQWRWSSYAATAGYELTPAWLHNDFILSKFSTARTEAQRLYREFVTCGVGAPSPLENVIGQIYLGSTAFIESILAKIEAVPRCSAIPRAQREAGRPDVAKVIATVSALRGKPEGAIARERGGVERMLVAYLARTEGLRKHREIAAGLNLRSEGTVSALVTRCEDAMAEDRELAHLVEQCRIPLRAQPPPLYTLPKPLTWI
jgi:REP element-mobilizing transposase RayT